jgi:WD40 repeat protein
MTEPEPSWPIDKLQRDVIDPYELRVAGRGNVENAPKELVAIWGDSRWKNSGYIKKITYSADGSRLATIGGAEGIVWDVSTGRAIAQIPAPGSWLEAIAISSEGGQVAIADRGQGGIPIWDVETQTHQRTLGGRDEGAFFLAYLPDRESLISVQPNGIAKLWNPNTGQLLRLIAQGLGHLTDAAVDPQGKLLATTGDEKVIRVWDIATGKKIIE